MCGFACVFNRRNVITNQELKNIASSVSFRGPDNTTVILTDNDFEFSDESGTNAFFFNRLSIIDLDQRSNQPFFDDRYILLFNGEIYNYLEIKNKLEKNNIIFHTTSDTEVLFKSLIYWGSDIIKDLNGMFSFVFVDKVKKKIIFSRDRTGIKPLYYGVIDNQLIIGSELDSLIKLADQKPNLNKSVLDLFLSFQYIPTPYTIWNDYYKLLPGSFVEIDLNDFFDSSEIVPTIYWDAYCVSSIKPDIKFDFENLLVNSIKGQLNSDVPVGFLLSSGIDSSLIAAIVNKHFKNDREYIFFTVAFDGIEESDESFLASNFLKNFDNLNFKHKTIKINSELIIKEAISFNKFLDEPFADYAVVLNYLISKEARKHVKVLISGDGADELFWGYNRYNAWNKYNLTSLSLYNLRNSIKPNFFSSFIRKFEFNRINSYENLVTILNTNTIKRKVWWRSSIDKIYNSDLLPSLIDMKSYLPDCMNYKVDRSSMAASIEVRVPYLDNFIIDYALQLSKNEKSNSLFKNKAPLKELLCKLAPHYKINTPKKGFSFPLNEWINKFWINEIIEKVNNKNKTFIDLDLGLNLDELINNHVQGKKDNSVIIWRLWMLINWLEKKYN